MKDNTSQVIQIQEACYEGYYWMSDDTAPTVLPQDTGTPWGITLTDTTNPFVIEGQLYDPTTHTSISIKYVDGHYIVKQYQISDTDFTSPEVTDLKFQSHRMGGRRLHFLQYWEAQNDPFCSDSADPTGMKTLKPRRLVFVGFDNN